MMYMRTICQARDELFQVRLHLTMLCLVFVLLVVSGFLSIIYVRCSAMIAILPMHDKCIYVVLNLDTVSVEIEITAL